MQVSLIVSLRLFARSPSLISGTMPGSTMALAHTKGELTDQDDIGLVVIDGTGRDSFSQNAVRIHIEG